MTNRAVLLADKAGPFLLGALACTGLVTRALSHIAFGLLVLWGLTVAARRPWRPAPPPLPPARWAAGLAIFIITWLAATLAGNNYWHDFQYIAHRVYIIGLLVPLAFLAFNQCPRLPAWLPFFYGLGLMTAAFLTFQAADYRLICIRARAHLSTTGLGFVLSQAIPILVGALLKEMEAGRKKNVAFLGLSLVSAIIAMTQNCTRHTMLVAPALSLMMIWVYRHLFRQRLRRLIPLLALAVAGLAVILSTGGGQRFLIMVESSKVSEVKSESQPLVLNSSDTLRLSLWRQGLAYFQADPIFGQGPAALQEIYYEEDMKRFHAHQVIISVLAKAGLVGFLGFLALHLAPLSLIWPHRRSPDPETFFWVWAALAVNLQFFLNGLTDQIFGLKPLMFIHWLVTAAALWRISRPPQPKPGLD